MRARPAERSWSHKSARGRRVPGEGAWTPESVAPAPASCGNGEPLTALPCPVLVEAPPATADVLVISVLDRETVERVVLTLDRRAEAPAEEVQGAADAGGVLEQLAFARSAARDFLTSPYVAAVARDTLERGTLVARFDGPAPVHGRGLGLAFLAGCLSIGLGAPLREGRIFYSSLSGPVGRTRMPGGGVRLKSLAGPEEARAAARIGRGSRVFLGGEDDRRGSEADSALRRDEMCRLPPVLSTAALASMSLDTRVLLERAAATDGGAAFCLLLLWSCGEVRDGASFPEGIGAALARLKARGRLTDDPAITDLVGDALSDPHGEAAAARASKRGIDARSEALLQRELAEASISADPDRPLFHRRTVGRGWIFRDDLGEWLEAEAPDTLQRLWLGLNVLGVCRSDRVPWYARAWGPVAVMCAAAATAAMGLLAWYGLTALTECNFAWGLWLLGALVGFVTLRTARRPDRNMAAFAAACTVLAVLIGSYLAVDCAQEAQLRKEADLLYARMMKLAPQVCSAQTENEIRRAIAEVNGIDAGDAPDVDAVSDDEVASFTSETRPRYRGVLEGDPTHGRFVSDYLACPWQERLAFFEKSMNLATLAWVLLGGALAFAFASGSLGRK